MSVNRDSDDETERLLPPVAAEEDEVPDTLDTRTKRLRLVKTGALSLLWLTMGLQNIVNPTLIDLRELLGCEHTYEELSRALVAKGACMLPGSLIGGFLVDRFRNHLDLFLGVWILIYGTGIILTPWMPSLVLLSVNFGVLGVVQGGISAGGNTLLMSMWGQGSAGAIQFLHSWFGVGLTVAPLLSAPFMSPTHCAVNTTNTTNTTQHHNSSGFDPETHIQIPYAICGGIGIFGGVVLLTLYALKVRITVSKSAVTNRTWRELFSPATCAGGKLCFGTTLMLLLFFIYLFMVGKDLGLTLLLEPLVVDSVHFTKTEGALLLTAYSASYTLARFVAAGLGFLIPLNMLFFVEIIGNLGAALGVILFPLQQKWHLWVFVSMFGFFAGPIYPSGMAWADQYIEMTALAVAVIDFGIGIGAAIGPWLCGYLLTYVGPMYPFYFCTMCTAALFVLAVAAQIVGSCNGRRERQ